VAGAAQPRPAPPPPRLSSVFGNTVRQIKLKLPQIISYCVSPTKTAPPDHDDEKEPRKLNGRVAAVETQFLRTRVLGSAWRGR
jgi:hypothetical protein